MKRKASLFLTLWLIAMSFAAQALPVASALDASAIKAKSLSLTPTSAVLRLGADGTGEPVALKAKVKPALASQVFDWQTSNPAVATVDNNGVVSPVGLGTAKITCSTTDMSNLKKQMSVSVKKLMVKSIVLGSTDYSMAPNQTIQLSCTIAPANAYDTSVKWSTSNAKVATVDQNGLVTAKKLGSCVITCKSPSSGAKAKAKIKVNFANSDIYYLSVGQENYMNSRYKLAGCKADADRFAATVKASNFGSLTAASGAAVYDLTGEGLRQALSDLPSWGMDENDVTYFYYSGHGAASGALVGTDYSTGGATSPLLEVSEIRDLLDRVPGTVVIAIDACYSGKFVTTKSLSAGGEFTQSFVSRFISHKSAKSSYGSKQPSQKYKLLVACRDDEMSYLIGDGLGSVFTQYLTQAGGVAGVETREIIVKKKMPADVNKDGAATVKEIYNYAYKRVLNRLKKIYGFSVDQHVTVWPLADQYPIFARLG